MTYCSIEEAWGTSFTHKGNRGKTDYDKIVADNASENGDNSTYGEVHYNQNNAFTKSGAPVLHRNRTSAYKKRRKSFSRTMKRLPNHSGPDNRYSEPYESKHLEFTDNIGMESYPTKRIRDGNRSTAPTYQNHDTPISSYNDELSQSLVAHEDSKHFHRHQRKRKKKTQTPRVEFESDVEYESEVEDHHPVHSESSLHEQEYSDSESESEYPHSEVASTKRHPREKRESYVDVSDSPHSQSFGRRKSKQLRENMFDIIIYVITGIFIIFILDVFVRLGKSST